MWNTGRPLWRLLGCSIDLRKKARSIRASSKTRKRLEGGYHQTIRPCQVDTVVINDLYLFSKDTSAGAEGMAFEAKVKQTSNCTMTGLKNTSAAVCL